MNNKLTTVFNDIYDDQFWFAIRATKGLLNHAIDEFKLLYRLEVSKEQIQTKIDENPSMYADICAEQVDNAELKLIDLMSDDNPTIALKATQYYLEAKGQDRGYGNKLIDDNDNNKIEGIRLIEDATYDS